MQKKLGVIGGLGTDTAADFYVESERLWHQKAKPSNIPFILENCQASSALIQSLVCSIQRIDELKDPLCHAASKLVDGGATLVVLPCNTAHVHIDTIRKSLKVPMLSITEEVAREIKKRKRKKAAILGTNITRSSGIYDKDCRSQGISTIYPLEKDQKKIEQIIQKALSWKNDESDTRTLLEVIRQVKGMGADMVVLACTDLQLCMPKIYPDDVIDSMKVLAEASVSQLLYQFEEI